MTLAEVIDTLQTWIRNADDEYDREEMGRVAGLKEALHEIKKIEPCEDAISRQAAKNAICDYVCGKGIRCVEEHECRMKKMISELSSVQPKPKTGHCKECKWWKDSDGVYRRGIEAESLCPINTNVVYFGDGYCYMYEPQENEC